MSLFKIAHAEPGPSFIYTNDETGKCVDVWLGDEYFEQYPEGRDWEEVMMVGEARDSVCEDVLIEIGTEFEGEANCEALYKDINVYGENSIYDPAIICEYLGYEHAPETPITSSETALSRAIEGTHIPEVYLVLGGFLALVALATALKWKSIKRLL